MTFNRHLAMLAWWAAWLALAVGAPTRASAEPAWQAAAVGAVAILPAPDEKGALIGGALSCAQQRWEFRLRSEPDETRGHQEALLTIDDTPFKVAAVRTEAVVAFPVDTELLEPIKAGSRLTISLAGGRKTAASFPLAGSRAAIETAASRCSPVDMSAYHRVELTAKDPAASVAAGLLSDEARLFRAATGKEPEMAAARLDFDEGRVLLFASLCGSTSYYGVSGCTLAGFVPDGDGNWRQVYDTEGVLLHTDPRTAHDGWPDLVTVPVSGDAEPSRWSWTGRHYSAAEPIVAADALVGTVSDLLRP